MKIHLALVALAFTAAPAFAGPPDPPRPSALALYPPEILGADQEEVTGLRTTILAELRAAGAEVVSPEQVDAKVKALPSGGCTSLGDEPRTLCLAELAKASGADRTLLLVVSPRARNELRITAEVVSARGLALKSVSRSWPRPEAAGVVPAVARSLRELLPELELDAPLPAVAAARAPPSALHPAPRSANPAPPPGTASWHRTAGWVGVGAGAALIAGGAYGLVSAARARSEFASHYLNGGHPPPALVPRLEALSGCGWGHCQTLGVLGAGAGALAAGVGAYLLLTAPQPATVAPPGSVQVSVGPGQVTWKVVLP